MVFFQKLPPFIFGIYDGNRNPSNVEEIVVEFFTKHRSLQNDDIEFRGVKMGIETYQFVCDVPARQLPKSIRSHKRYWHCKQRRIKGLA